MRPLTLATTLALAILSVPTAPRPRAFLDLDQCPGVADVTTSRPADGPTIVHILDWIIERTGIDTAGVEGIAPDDIRLFRILSRMAWKGDEPTTVRLNVGAAGRALAEGWIRDVLPIENAVTHADADPFDDDGELRDVAEKSSEIRDAAIVRALLTAEGPVWVVILGGAHDLTGEISQQSGGRCRYVRVAAGKVRGLARRDVRADHLRKQNTRQPSAH
ncbi:MAG: hypothetical protein IT428_15780 [Planctomycetaceae bacterium]|nr:hypothetical protein [Planctomycetaceae bacterium]